MRPREEVARFLAGNAPCAIVAPASQKKFDLRVVVPVEFATVCTSTVPSSAICFSLDPGSEQIGSRSLP